MRPEYTLWQLTLYFLQLGSLGWGGPVALVGYMHRDLVESKKWISEEDYREGMTLSQLAPGPLAAQLAIYLGYVHYRVQGATLTGLAFVLPSLIMVIGLGIAYVQFGGLVWMQSVFYGVSACVIGIIALSSYRLFNRTVGSTFTLRILFLLLALSTYVTEREIVWFVILAGVVNWIVQTKFSSIHMLSVYTPVLLQPATASSAGTLWEIGIFFGTAGAFVFGSGLAIIPFLYGGVVKELGWLTEQQFVDSVAVAMITPGPVVITVGFIGYLVSGFWGAVVAAGATFLPCYLFTILPAPYMKRYGKHVGIKAFVDGVTAAATGAIAGAVLIMGKRTLVDIPSIIIAIITLILLLRFKKIIEPWLIVAAALAGLVIKSNHIIP